MSRIFHLVRPEVWEKSLEKGKHTVPSLQSEGFIHCSSYEQVLGSANKHYPDGEELLVLVIPEKWVKNILKWEESRGGALFPHLYGPLPVEKVETLRILQRGENREWNWVKEY